MCLILVYYSKVVVCLSIRVVYLLGSVADLSSTVDYLFGEFDLSIRVVYLLGRVDDLSSTVGYLFE